MAASKSEEITVIPAPKTEEVRQSAGRCCRGRASANQNCRAALCRIQRFLGGTEARDGGEVTSDKTGSTSVRSDSLRATVQQPGRDGMEGRGANSKDNTNKVSPTQRKCTEAA
ncbi:Hypothetical predicted protein [Xyrichtys novacula]|uniref:Uncharacterized protein n=1 Tax=Xyrichtys novacula TaxID=13765 RepID=A0AAV1FPD8_XYRNO|nr:Hypothetical predicted protein [Xyrichtys novacula]